ncbi:hypothetical protein GCM10010260_73130 [Streptomyces filipinensis]|uniref:Uncharacterized protein n=1 Tax=Streptomyces filipinensis TaxID=66887 RepID=A0A918MEM4_9ACTN|nr:hypothetical protein GCM10010260_73130 [Streptomyces filipinensis]
MCFSNDSRTAGGNGEAPTAANRMLEMSASTGTRARTEYTVGTADMAAMR